MRVRLPRLVSSYVTFTSTFPPDLQGEACHYKQELWISFPRVRTQAAHCQAELGVVNCEFSESGGEVLFKSEHVPKVALHLSVVRPRRQQQSRFPSKQCSMFSKGWSAGPALPFSWGA